MTPENAKEEFEYLIRRSGMPMGDLTPAQGIRLMLDFYANIRADNCEADDGDMLLFEWGTYNWGDGLSFQLNIARQFITQGEDEDDSAILQLSFTFHFNPSAQFDALQSGNRWCSSPDELRGFEAFITGSKGYRTVQALKPLKVTLDWSVAE